MLAGGPAVPLGPASDRAAAAGRSGATDAAAQRELARCVQRRAQPSESEGNRPAEPPESRPASRSQALLLRSKLRSAGTAGRVTLQRAVTTSGGEWDTDKYDPLRDVDAAGSPVPAARGVRGVDIELKFTPNAHVNAELIGLTQSVQAVVGGAPAILPAAAARAIPAADAKAINTGAGETDEGTAIDQSATNTNPIYAVESSTSASLGDASDPRFGENGWHYKDGAGKDQHKAALLKDRPWRPNAQKDARHIFETTALATKGVQAGTYYGSVRWGWRTDAAATLTKIALEKVSDGVPSSTFLKAAGIWNAGTNAAGTATVDLPTPDVKVTTGPVTVHPDRMSPAPTVALPVGARLQIVTPWQPPLTHGTVRIVDGPHTGHSGEVSAAEWPLIADERA